MDKINTIIMYDQDACSCYAVLKTKENPKKIADIIQKVKDSMPGEWSFDDLMYGIYESGIDCEVDENVTYINF